jgi:hypothetical protein
MRPLSDNDIESELSYAYLHAVASKAGVGCTGGTRHQDNRGVDATVTAWNIGANKDEIDIKIQLKAHKGMPTEKNGFFSYFLKDNKASKRYNELRAETRSTHRLLIVLFLPKDESQWLSITPESLIMKNCAYWVSLRGAPAPSGNDTGETVYIPKAQVFNFENLKGIFEKISNKEDLTYQIRP